MTKFYLISAICDANNGIGFNNKLPWNIPDDLKYFQKITKDHVIIMGRSTYESIGRPLKNRFNIVLSQSPELYKNSENICFTNLEKLNDVLRDVNETGVYHETDVFVIGGEQVYNIFIDQATGLFVTRVKKNVDCDSFFPTFIDTFDKIRTSRYYYCIEEECSFCYEYYESKSK